MNNFVSVAVENRRQNLLEGFSCLLLAEGLLLKDLVEELSTCAQLSDDVEEALLLIKFEHLNDIGVVLFNFFQIFNS